MQINSDPLIPAPPRLRSQNLINQEREFGIKVAKAEEILGLLPSLWEQTCAVELDMPIFDVASFRLGHLALIWTDSNSDQSLVIRIHYKIIDGEFIFDERLCWEGSKRFRGEFPYQKSLAEGDPRVIQEMIAGFDRMRKVAERLRISPAMVTGG